MGKIYYIIFFFLLIVVCYPQQGFAKLGGKPLIDSLLQELPKQKEDTNQANILITISFTYYAIDPDTGIKFGHQALALATKLNWQKGIAAANNYIGVNNQYKADYPKALEYYTTALKIFKELNYKKGIASALSNFANVFNAQSDYPHALDYYFKALKTYEEIEDKQGVAITNGNIGILYDEQSNYNKALEYYAKALKVDEELGNKQAAANVAGSIGIVYEEQGDNVTARDYYFKSLKIFEEAGNKHGIASVSGDIGNSYNKDQNYTQAVAWHFKGLNAAGEIGDKSNQAYYLGDIGGDFVGIVINGEKANKTVTNGSELPQMPYNTDSLIPKGKTALLNKAVECLNGAIDLDKKLGNLMNLQSNLRILSIADSLLGDYKGALAAISQYIIYKDSVFSQGNSLKIARIELAKKIETDSLKSEQARSVADLKLTQQRHYTYAGVAGILALAAFSFFIVKERKKSDKLLLNILPAEVAAELKDKGSTAARHYENVTVLFTDFVNFTTAGEKMSAQALIDELHTCFKTFDEITAKYGIEKIKTIGDAYLAVCGLPKGNPDHAENVVKAAKEIGTFMETRYARLGDKTFEIRIGVHSGNVVAGIVGVKKFAYDIWGDTVNTAARMEQSSEPGRINISETTYELVKDKFVFEYRGIIEAKNKGGMKMYFVV